MDNIDYGAGDEPVFFEYNAPFASADPRSHSYPPVLHPNQHQTLPWTTVDPQNIGGTIMTQQQQQLRPRQNQQEQDLIPSRSHQQHDVPSGHIGMNANNASQPINIQTSSIDTGFGMVASQWHYQMQQQSLHQGDEHRGQHPQQQFTMEHAAAMGLNTYAASSFGSIQASPVALMPSSTSDAYTLPAAMDTNAMFAATAGPMESMASLSYPLTDYQNEISYPLALSQHALNQEAIESCPYSLPGSSPTGTSLEVQSVSDNEWSMINHNPNRNSSDSYGTVSNPSQNLHIRTNSDSSNSEDLDSAELSGSFEEVSPWALGSPHEHSCVDYVDSRYAQQVVQDSSNVGHIHRSQPACAPASTSSSSTSPTSSGPASPPLRRRKSPMEGKTTKAVIKKTNSHGPRKENVSEKKIGRRRGPLRPEQRQQAHEIRKLRACLRCKFLKKTCDKGDTCTGCRPSHARLWQVPCTRLDIKDIAYFMKDWKADFERHVSLGFSVGNIKGFSNIERTLYITHGFGFYLPINVREVFVRNDECFGMTWVESIHEKPRAFELNTAKLSAGIEGVSTLLLSEYLDKHLHEGFDRFVADFFEGTPFLTEILLTAHRYYKKEQTPSVGKALKLVLAYNLTQQVTMVEGLTEEEQMQGKIDTDRSRWHGHTIAPVMINFQVKCALADMWRELQKDILEELSTLYSSVYSGDKLKNWPTIFMLAAILLAIWEEMQFDCHYRVLDEKVVNTFCTEMEKTPVGVIVGLFQAISTKLPGLQEWETRKHHHLLNSNPAICDALTEVKEHINKHEKYLKTRQEAQFDRNDFDCLSNKFLSKLVIRAN